MNYDRARRIIWWAIERLEELDAWLMDRGPKPVDCDADNGCNTYFVYSPSELRDVIEQLRSNDNGEEEGRQEG